MGSVLSAKETRTVCEGLSLRTGNGSTTVAGPAPRRLPVKASATRSWPGPYRPSSAALVAPSCRASHMSSSTTVMSTDSAMMPVTAQSSPVWVTMSEVKMGSPRKLLLSRTNLAMIDFTSSAATTCPPTPPTSALVALMKRATSAGFFANTYDLYEKMFGVLVTGIFSVTVTGSPASSSLDCWYSVILTPGGPSWGP